MKPTAPSLAGLSQKCKLTCAAAVAGLLFAVSSAQAQALTPKQESIIPIAALTAEGDAARLKTVLADALNRKSMTVNEMKDVLLQMYAYTGFPRSLTGLGVLVNLLDERHAAEMLKGEAALSGTVDFDAISPEEAAKIPNDLYREGLEYYGRTHRHPNATFSYTTSSLMDLMTWDATDQIELISVPLLMIAGSQADSLYMTQDAFAKATGTSDKELYEIPGATHIKTYYVPEYVDQEVAKLSEFFGRTLK